MKRIYRSQADKKIAGICGGLAEVFSVDPTLVRLGVVFVGMATGVLPIVVTYIVGWIVIPQQPGQYARGTLIEASDVNI
jgi:phage shock protein PspC (stress-responsive transcriptional regulator)